MDVLLMAVRPDLPLLLSLFVMVRARHAQFALPPVLVSARAVGLAALPALTGSTSSRWWRIVAFLFHGFSPVASRVLGHVVTFAMSFLDRANALVPRRLVQALKDGSLQR